MVLTTRVKNYKLCYMGTFLERLIKTLDKAAIDRDFRTHDGKLARKIIYKNNSISQFEGTLYEKLAYKLYTPIKVNKKLREMSRLDKLKKTNELEKQLKLHRCLDLVDDFNQLEKHGIWFNFYLDLFKPAISMPMQSIKFIIRKRD